MTLDLLETELQTGAMNCKPALFVHGQIPDR
jgi:hypothetical protein